MSSKILIIFSSVDGHTLMISKQIMKKLSLNAEVELISIEEINKKITDYDIVIIGSSIRYGVHNKKIISFINTHKKELDLMKTAFFSVNLVARNSDKNTPSTNPYVIKFFKSIEWRPIITEVFAGKLNYKQYSMFDRIMIRFIMWMTKGPTHPSTNIEYTNWDKVDAFAESIAKM